MASKAATFVTTYIQCQRPRLLTLLTPRTDLGTRSRSFHSRNPAGRITSTAMARNGYDPDFLGPSFALGLPMFSADLDSDLLTGTDKAVSKDSPWTPYIHYSLATSKPLRSTIVVCHNIDQNKIRRAQRSRWKVDNRIGKYQLDNSYYRNNRWDRGHLVRRAVAAWGDSPAEAQKASDDTMLFTNCALQADTFNQDEWLRIEDYVRDLEDDKTNRLCVFTGPIYSDSFDVDKRYVSPRGRGLPAEVPPAFFKIVAFVAKNGRLGVRAFIAVQDEKALSDKNGKRGRMHNLCTYQVSVTMIEKETGIIFPQEMKDANPLRCDLPDRPEIPPELIRVTGPDDMVNDINEPRPDAPANPPVFSNVRVAAAKVAADPSTSASDWVSLVNVGGEDVSLRGWKLLNGSGVELPLCGVLMRGLSQVFMLTLDGGKSLAEVKPASDGSADEEDSKGGGILLLKDDSDFVVYRVKYTLSSVQSRGGMPMNTFNESSQLE